MTNRFITLDCTSLQVQAFLIKPSLGFLSLDFTQAPKTQYVQGRPFLPLTCSFSHTPNLRDNIIHKDPKVRVYP